MWSDMRFKGSLLKRAQAKAAPLKKYLTVCGIVAVEAQYCRRVLGDPKAVERLDSKGTGRGIWKSQPEFKSSILRP